MRQIMTHDEALVQHFDPEAKKADCAMEAPWLILA